MPSCPVAGSLGENAIVMMSACDGRVLVTVQVGKLLPRFRVSRR